MRAAIFHTDGRILRILTAPAGNIAMNIGPGQDWAEVAEGVRDDTHYIAGFQAVAMPTRPSLAHVFDYAAKAWVDPRTLADFKALRWTQLKKRRDAHEFGGFTWDGSTFDSDAISQSRIQGGAQMAQLAAAAGQPFTADWTLADNTVRTLTGAQMLSVGLAMGHHIEDQHAIGRALRQQVMEAATPAAVAAVCWPGEGA